MAHGALAAVRRRQVRVDIEATQRRIAGTSALPLPPDEGTKPPSDPPVEAVQYRRGFAEAKVSPPPDEVAGQLRDEAGEADTLGTSCYLPDPRLEPGERLRRDAPLRRPPAREAEAQKGPRRWTVHCALRRVHPQFQPPGKEAFHACHDPLARAPGPHVDVAVVGVADEAVAALLQFLIQDVQHQVRQQRRERTALRRSLGGWTDQPTVQHPRGQETANELEQAFVGHALGHQPHQDVVVHPVEEFLQIEIDHDGAARSDVVPARALPPDGPSVRAETRSSHPRNFRPSLPATPASPLAG